jgi:hypothetical protein
MEMPGDRENGKWKMTDIKAGGAAYGKGNLIWS